MYKVVNKTTHIFDAGDSILKPNESITIKNNVFYDNFLKSKELGVCEIVSEYGEHHATCYGNIACTPETGFDGTKFVLSEKRKINN